MAYIGNTNTTQAFTPQVDYFSGDGSTTAFTLSRPVASVAQVQAVIENVPQNPGSAFTVSGNTVTFTSAPPSGANNIYVYYTSPITQVLTLGQGVVYPSSLSTGGPSWDSLGNVTLTGSITLNNGFSDGAQLTLASAGYSNWNWDNYSGRLRAYYNATEYFTIDTSGNVGIGTSSPSQKLTVYSASGDNRIRMQSAGSVNTGIEMVSTAGTGYFDYNNQAFSWITGGSERARIDSSGVLYFNSGYGSAGAAYGCRAWVSFNGNGTVSTNQTINGSANVTSVFKNATGDYTVNFTNAMPSATYAAVVTTQTLTSLTSGGNAMGVLYPTATPKTTTSVRVANYQGNAITLLNATDVCVAIFR